MEVSGLELQVGLWGGELARWLTGSPSLKGMTQPRARRSLHSTKELTVHLGKREARMFTLTLLSLLGMLLLRDSVLRHMAPR